jgi:alpha-D-ribose 1-methylphosphonate 5-triphosphate synthase subunit PhnG
MGDRVLVEFPTLAEFEGDLTRLGPRRYHARLALLIAALVQAAELRGSLAAHGRLIRQRSRCSDRGRRGLP